MKNELYLFDLEQGNNIIGIDEAGRGPLAGPVVATAVKLIQYSDELLEINDSKKLSEKKREKLFEVIERHFKIGIGISNVEEIDDINILNATFLAMNRAIEEIKLKGEKNFKLLVDGNLKIKNCSENQLTIVKGDSKSLSIAAASIIAKVTRDRLLIDLSKKYEGYSFEKHKGYGTKAHIEAIRTFGPISGVHRVSFLGNILR